MQIKFILFCHLQDFATVTSGELQSKAESEVTAFLLIMQEFARFSYNFMLKMTRFSYKIILIYASFRNCAMMKPRRVE